MMQGSLAEKLRVLRARMGLSLTEAATRAGVTRDTLSDLEHGKRHPYMPTLSKIAAGYGVPVEDLLEEPALAGKAVASETGPSADDAKHRGELEEIRESYRDSRDGMDRYCAWWEQRLAEDALDRHSVQEFLRTAEALLPVLRDSVVSELMEIRREFSHVGDSGISDEMRAESVMYPLVDRYFEIGGRLQKVWQERFADDADVTEPPVIDFVAKRQERLLRRAG